jgi:hypothetical protein
MLHLAELSYEEDGARLAGALASDYPRFQSLPLRLGFVAGSNTEVVVAFTGSRDGLDWAANIVHQLVLGYGGRVHKGFAVLAEQVAESVDAALADFRDNRQEVYLTGHSRGGALAALTASRLHTARLAPTGVFTFGAPRFGDSEFARKYLLTHFRIEDVSDLVPCLPFLSGYTAVGTSLTILRNGAVYQADGTWMDQFVLFSQLVADPAKDRSLDRHAIEHMPGYWAGADHPNSRWWKWGKW